MGLMTRAGSMTMRVTSRTGGRIKQKVNRSRRVNKILLLTILFYFRQVPGQGTVHHLAVRQLHRQAPRFHQPQRDQHPGREHCRQWRHKGGVQCVPKVPLFDKIIIPAGGFPCCLTFDICLTQLDEEKWRRAKTPWLHQVLTRTGEIERDDNEDNPSSQMFWISAGNTWCSKYRPKSLEMRIRTGAHSPGQFRVQGPFSNSKEFSKDFKCPAGSPMIPLKKCEVW